MDHRRGYQYRSRFHRSLHKVRCSLPLVGVLVANISFYFVLFRFNYLGAGANVTIRISMGSVVDFFRARRGHTLCNMLVCICSHLYVGDLAWHLTHLS